MAQTVNTISSGRQAALARRQALIRGGKAAVNGTVSAASAKPAARSDTTGAVGRAASVARRRAMSTGGKRAVGSQDRVRVPAPRATAQKSGANEGASGRRPAAAATARKPSAVSVSSSRAVVIARRQAMSTHGKRGVSSRDRVRGAELKGKMVPEAGAEKSPADCGCGCKGDCGGNKVTEVATNGTRPRKPQRTVKRRPTVQPSAANNSRVAALARRQAMSARGKAGLNASGMTAAQTVRAANPQISGRELAQALRTQRSRQGKTEQRKSSPCGRVRPPKNAPMGGAQDAPWKVGASETTQGQVVTGTMVGRSPKTTGDEPSTCRDVTGTEYMGADIFRDFCQSEPDGMPPKVALSATLRGTTVTGVELGRSQHVTGDEPGSCQQVTGVEYLGAGHAETFCGARPESAPIPAPAKVARAETRKGKPVTGNKVGRSSRVTGDETGAGRELTGSQYMESGGEQEAPAKVGVTKTLRGGSVTGTMVGRSERVTGDEPGSCRIISGDDYVGGEQYRDFCATTPAPQDAKVGVSETFSGKVVTGTMTGRSGKVTGDEPGTCKAITGTGYAGAEQYYNYCKPEASAVAAARASAQRGTAGAVLTGQQPGIGGKLTGTEKGSCEPLTGTPYIGADQYAGACTAAAAEPGSPDFPQSLSSEDAPWGKFSVPNMAAQAEQEDPASVTGTRYAQGQITGPFGMATGKVTGTEEFRSARSAQGSAGNVSLRSELAQTAMVAGSEGRMKSRISGEGIASRITGNDWDTGDLVTGTEGRSAMRRNPTRRGNTVAPTPPGKRNEDVSEPVNKVTGSSGSTDKGSLVTYSGGARG